MRNWSEDDLRGTLCGIYISPVAGAKMQSVTRANAVAGSGLEGDRYALGAGHWKATDACQVTLVAAEDMEKAEHESGLPFDQGEHRRNLIVRGIPLAVYRSNDVRIGDALFRFHRLRPPCGYLERLLGPGAMHALRKRGGIGLTVVAGGVIRIGDKVSVIQRNARV